MTLWLIDRNQSHYRLTDSFAPAFYVSGPEERLIQLRDAAQRKTTELRTRLTERTDLWLNAARPVLEVSVLRPSNFIGWGRWVHRLDSKLQLYNSDLMVASLYCWEKRLFPLAFVEVEANDDGTVLSIACRDDEWALDYEMPPLKSCRFGYPALRGSIRRTVAARRSKSKWTALAGSLTKRESLRRFNLRDCSNATTPM